MSNKNFLSPNPINHGDSSSEDGDTVVASCEALLPQSDRDHSTVKPSNAGKYVTGSKPLHSADIDPEMTSSTPEISERRKYAAVAVLFFINLLNYMDRFTIAGVLLQIQEYFNINNANAGLLQTVFIISYMVVAPLFGYLGDRCNRKITMLVGMLIWSGCTLGASFINNPDQFLVFLALRGLVGVGEASYSTIAPTLIADLFVKDKRTRMLSVFFFAIPVGSGLGYIIGSASAQAFGSWHWALRVTPWLGVLAMILMLIVIPNPRRGASETTADLVMTQKQNAQKNSYFDDLRYILKNKTFMLVTVGFTFMAFVVGSLTIWGPIFVAYAQVVAGNLSPCTDERCEYGNISFVFGVVTCMAGFIGVWVGAESAKKWRERGRANADALICAIGLILAAPLLLVGFQFAAIELNTAWMAIFLADVCLCFTWTLVGDMTLYVTMPSRRSTANSVQILTMHLLGDAGSPYLLGVLSDTFSAAHPDTYYWKYLGLQRAMYVTLFASILGGAGFLFASIFLVHDKKKVADALAGKTSETSSPAASDSSGSMELSDVTTTPPEPNYVTNVDYSGSMCYTEDDRHTNQVSYPGESPPYISVIHGRKTPGSELPDPAKVPLVADRVRVVVCEEGDETVGPNFAGAEKRASDTDSSNSSTSLLLKESDI